MSSLFTRNPGLEEATASLFTDEKIAQARSRVIEWLNNAPITGTQTSLKCETIAKVQEVILNSDSELLEEFISDVLAYSHDTAQEVRKTVVCFIEEVCKLHIEFMPNTIDTLAGLLRDTSPQVIKRVIQACAAVYKHTIQWLVSLADVSDNTEKAWNTLCIMKGEILDMIDHDNDGIRTNAIKFLEGVVIMQTYPDEDSMKRDNDFSLEDIPMTMKIVRRRKLEDEAIHVFESLLKFHAASHISSVNLIACTGTLCTIAKMRPSLMSPVIDALKSLHSNLPPTLTDSQVSSVKKHLKMQLINILKQNASYEMHSTITVILSDLGASNQEISRAIPKIDKQEHHRRAKRALENATAAASMAKRQRLERESKEAKAGPAKRQMEIDYDEVDEQKRRSTRINETFIIDNLKTPEMCVELVMASMTQTIPNDMPQHFARNYQPIKGYTIAQVVQKIAQGLAPLMTEKRLGPGATVITKEPPMRMKVTLEEEKNIILGLRKDQPPITEPMEINEATTEGNEETFATPGETDGDKQEEDNDLRREEATKKLRENMERAKGELSAPKIKQPAKSLKLQEVTKPMSRLLKEKFLLQSVMRVLQAERKSIAGGVAAKRRKIVTVLAATFTGSVRETIIQFIMSDLQNRLDLAFSWLYEEYSLLQGFTRHSYIKSEQKPDFAYNKLLGELITSVIDNPDTEMDKAIILHKIYMEAPLISDEAFNQLLVMCELAEYCDLAMRLISDLTVHRPPKQMRFLNVLLRFSVHENVTIRERAIDQVIILYAEHKILVDKIEEHALLWLSYLDQPKPAAAIFSSEFGRADATNLWTEDLSKVCLSLFFAVMPYHEQLVTKLSQIYVSTSSEMKRTILRAIDTPIKKMGPESMEILHLIETCPKGAETLITRIIYILTEKASLNKELVNRVRELYQTKVSDVRLIIPVINGLTRSEILTALPKLLKLSEIVVKEVFSRLLAIGKHADQKHLPLTASDLLVSLHMVDATKVELKYVVKATSLCLSEKDVYSQDVLAIVLQQLVEITPIPTLLMRTVIQSLTLYPRLAGYVTNLLQRLIPKQVWRQKVIWDGFLKCCQRLRPNSLPVLMTLPPQQLQEALNTCPELRQPMIDHANTIIESQGGSVSKITMDILLGNSQDLFITEISGLPEYGTVIPTYNIKQEIEEPMEQFLNSSNQPLPPGEEM